MRKKTEVADNNSEKIEGISYQTIASVHADYKDFHVINTYPTLSEARKHYTDDMKAYAKESGASGLSYGIRMLDERNKEE